MTIKNIALESEKERQHWLFLKKKNGHEYTAKD
jgi:hypothetical protein